MTADHTTQFEEVMALLDNQLPAEAAERVGEHLRSCDECRRLASELGAVSERLHSWTVGKAPATLQPHRKSRWFGEGLRLAAAAAVIVVTATAAALIFQDREKRAPASQVATEAARATVAEGAEQYSEKSFPHRVGGNLEGAVGRTQGNTVAQPIAGNPAPPPSKAPSGPSIIRTASLSIVVRDHEAGRAELERIARSVDGFIGNLVASGARGSAPSLNATLRVPAARLDETLAALKRLGSVQHERQGSDDVTQQSVDLDARLANARASEVRLSDILKTRTGRLSDVLDVEREIARVRGEIEQMEAERKSMDHQIAYATVQIELSTERKAEGIAGPMSVSTRLRNAVVDGFAGAVESAISLAVFLAEVVPTVLLWIAMIAPLAWFIRRRRLSRA